MSVQTIQKRILSDRQQDYAPEDEVIFNLNPSDIQVLAGKNSYLKLDFTITTPTGGSTGFGSAAKASLDYFGGGGYSLIDRLQVWSGDGGTLIENCEEVPSLVGTNNYYSKTPGLHNTRNLFEGLNSNNDGTVPNDSTSQYYSMLTCDGNPHFQTVSLCLPLKFSGTLYGRVFPVEACGGLQVRIMLSSAAKALKADLSNGMVVQRDRTGRLPELQDLPFNADQPTNAAPFTTGTNPKVGQVSQQLPQTFQLASGGGGAGELTVGAGVSIAQVTVQPATATVSTVSTDCVTTGGTGTGLLVTVTIGLVVGTVSALNIGTVAGSGYEVGDIITIASGVVTGSTVDMAFSLSAADFTSSSTLTSVRVMKTGVVGIPQMAVAGQTPSLLRSNILASNNTFVSCLGQGFWALDDAGAVVNLTNNSPAGISSVDSTNPAYITVGWANPTVMTSTFTPANNCSCFGAVLDPNVVVNLAQTLSYKIENIQLVCENVSEKGYVAAMMAKVKSQGGLTLDIKTYNVLRQNLFKNQTVSQLLIPTTSYRVKSLLQHMQIPYENLGFSYWRPVNDNLRQYQYMIKDKNTPNRRVTTSSEHSPAQNGWDVVCDHERTKCLAAGGLTVRRETHPSGRFVFGRALATAGHSFNANRNQCRLSQDWGISMNTGGGVTQQVLPQYDKLMLTFVPHFRKVQMQGGNVVVTY